MLQMNMKSTSDNMIDLFLFVRSYLYILFICIFLFYLSVCCVTEGHVVDLSYG